MAKREVAFNGRYPLPFRIEWDEESAMWLLQWTSKQHSPPDLAGYALESNPEGIWELLAFGNERLNENKVALNSWLEKTYSVDLPKLLKDSGFVAMRDPGGNIRIECDGVALSLLAAQLDLTVVPTRRKGISRSELELPPNEFDSIIDRMCDIIGSDLEAPNLSYVSCTGYMMKSFAYYCKLSFDMELKRRLAAAGIVSYKSYGSEYYLRAQIPLFVSVYEDYITERSRHAHALVVDALEIDSRSKDKTVATLEVEVQEASICLLASAGTSAEAMKTARLRLGNRIRAPIVLNVNGALNVYTGSRKAASIYKGRAYLEILAIEDLTAEALHKMLRSYAKNYGAPS